MYPSYKKHPALKQQLFTVASWSANALTAPPSDAIICDFLSRVSNQTLLIDALEAHGLTPSFQQWITPHLEHIEKAEQKRLKILSLRQKIYSEAIHQAIIKITETYQQAGLSMALLKGSALAYTIYDTPQMRMMADIDILVDPEYAQQGFEALKQHGFKQFSSSIDTSHHHLEPLFGDFGGHQIMLEVHTKALSNDLGHTIDYQHLEAPLVAIETQDFSTYTLNHIDTLTLLCRHTFARDKVIKLSGIVDIIRYAQQHFDHIDWHKVKSDYPFIINTIRLIDPVIPRTGKLQQLAPAIDNQNIRKLTDLGYGMAPLREAKNRQRPLSKRLRQLLITPTWWTYVFYNIPPEKNLLRTRFFTHPRRLLLWLFKRLP